MKPSISSKKFKILVSILALSILLTSAVSPAFWYFIPVSFAFLFSLDRTRFPILLLVFCAAQFLIAQDAGLFRTQLDYLSYAGLISAGLVIGIFKTRLQALARSLALCFLLISLGAGLLFLYAYISSSVETWSAAQLESHLIPLLFRESSWTEDWAYFYKNSFQPLFNLIVVGAFGFYFGLVIIFNLLLFRMLSPQLEAGRRFWEKFSRWRPSEWVLVPFVTGLVLLALSYALPSTGAWNWWAWWGWNITILSLYPFSVNGLSILSFLLPRLGIFFVFLTIFLFIFLNPYPFLILAGWADIWFDFRRRMRSNPKSD